jgi:hypothetical protein
MDKYNGIRPSYFDRDRWHTANSNNNLWTCDNWSLSSPAYIDMCNSKCRRYMCHCSNMDLIDIHSIDFHNWRQDNRRNKHNDTRWSMKCTGHCFYTDYLDNSWSTMSMLFPWIWTNVNRRIVQSTIHVHLHYILVNNHNGNCWSMFDRVHHWHTDSIDNNRSVFHTRRLWNLRNDVIDR